MFKENQLLPNYTLVLTLPAFRRTSINVLTRINTVSSIGIEYCAMRCSTSILICNNTYRLFVFTTKPSVCMYMIYLRRYRWDNINIVLFMFVCLYVYMCIFNAGDISTAISLEPAMKFNGGGHINHSIFWTNLSPQGGGVPKG